MIKINGTRYKTAKELAKEYKVSKARIHKILSEGRFEGAVQIDGLGWLIPENAPDPRNEGAGRPFGSKNSGRYVVDEAEPVEEIKKFNPTAPVDDWKKQLRGE